MLLNFKVRRVCIETELTAIVQLMIIPKLRLLTMMKIAISREFLVSDIGDFINLDELNINMCETAYIYRRI